MLTDFCSFEELQWHIGSVHIPTFLYTADQDLVLWDAEDNADGIPCEQRDDDDADANDGVVVYQRAPTMTISRTTTMASLVATC